MSEELVHGHCQPCEGGTPALDRDRALRLHQQIPAWTLEEGRISRSFRFKDFMSGLQFVNQIAAIAEEEGHHPDLHLGWGLVEVELTTHAAGGLTENDFILAAKIDRLQEPAGGAES